MKKENSNLYVWEKATENLYTNLIKQKKRTIKQDEFIARYESRLPAGVISKMLQNRSRD